MITGGGTGGHIFPALAIADGIMGRWPSTVIRYIGARGSMESRLVPEAGYLFSGITAKGWQGRKFSTLTAAIASDIKGKKEAAEILSSFEPVAIIGTGGFASLPVVMAGVQQGISIYLHEQNALPGLTNRLAALWADQILLTFDEAKGRFPYISRKKTVMTGLPVRESIASADPAKAYEFFGLNEKKKTILATGGSQGAAGINRAMLHVIKSLYGSEGVQIILATGRRDYDHMVSELATQGIVSGGNSPDDGGLRIYPFIDRMDLAYSVADIFVGRSGASTLAEITLSRLPAVLVPYPHASENHQSHNAESLVDKGGAVLIEEKRLNGSVLLSVLQDLLADDDRRLAMAECSYRAAHGSALDDILAVLGESIDFGY